MLERFFKALREGDVKAVEGQATKDPSLVTAYAPNQWCCREIPLGVAAGRDDFALATLLLDLGADPNQKTAWWAGGFAPLHVVSAEQVEMIDLLIDRGANVDVQAAAALARLGELTALLDHDPFLVNKPGGDGGRPLHFAADAEVAKLLVDRGATLDPVDVDHGSTPAQWAVRDRQDVTRFLIAKGAKTDLFMLAALGEEGRLSEWLEDNPEDATKVLSPEEFASPGSKGGHIYQYVLTGFGSTALHVAARCGSAPAIRLLHEAGADIAVRGGYDDQTPLHFAASADKVDAIRQLAQLGADLNALSGSEHKTPPLVWAIVFGAVESVRVLLEMKADVTPAVTKSVKAGVKGDFQQHSDSPMGAWKQIQELVAAG
ncbi:MAG: ankyrin repeat domain-containing protein [Longimicrobiales bacterium]